jgi:hypothetical protein
MRLVIKSFAPMLLMLFLFASAIRTETPLLAIGTMFCLLPLTIFWAGWSMGRGGVVVVALQNVPDPEPIRPPKPNNPKISSKIAKDFE